MTLPIRGINIIVIVSVFNALSVLIVFLRLYSRHLKRKSLDINDYAAITALVFTLAMGAGAIVGVVAGGWGYHESELSNPLEQNITSFKVLFAMQILWGFANTSAKISLCHLYTTIFRGKLFRTAVFAAVGLSIAYLLSVVLQTILICTPEALNWNKTLTYGHCGNKYAADVTVGIGNLVTDVVIIVLPMPFIWKLQLPVPHKLGLTGIFGVGVLICIVTIVRITKLVAAVSSSHSSDPTTLSLTPDASYDLCNIAFWTLLEPLLGTICCCLPVLQPAIKKFSEMMTMMTTRRHATPSSYGSSSSSSSGKPKTAPKQKRHRSFQRMTEDGIFPLVELEREVYAVYDQDSTMEIPSPSAQGILVRQEWGVSSV